MKNFSSTVYTTDDAKSGYTYSIINNEAAITGFSGEPTYINIPEIIDGCRVTEIKENSFYNCLTLKHIDIPETVEKIGHHAFYACLSLENIVIPDSVTEIGMGSFCGCDSLRSVSLPENLTEIPDSCFRSCTSLTNIIIPQNIERIGEFCFSGCTSLMAVSIGDNTKSLDDCSFYMCSSLKNLYIPDSVEKIGSCAVGYIPTPEGSMTMDGFIVLGSKKSVAKKYADENNLTFEDVGNSLHAFAVQRINGQRITVPSVFVAGVAILFVSALFMTFSKTHNAKKNRKRKIKK
ncbi:MAG: leucine-rich repeat domain-containing protein [Ruminococcus sp.]|nr:leucine-rich repeat domain-containing protein [Ruminococcus sp.]